MRLNDELLEGGHVSEPESTPADAPGSSNVTSNTVPATSSSGDTEQDSLNVNGRRGRSNSDLDAGEQSRLRRRAFMEQTMDFHNLRGPDREQGQRFADLEGEEQFMFCFSFLLSQRAQVDNLAAVDFLRSDVYEQHVVSRIKVGLLAPWLSNYVTLLQEFLLNDILRNKESWRVPAAVTDVAEQWQHFSSEFKTKATQIRSQFKSSMYRMRAKEWDVNVITRALAPKGMVIKEHTRGRVAWILLASVEFDELCEARETSPSKFWEWIGAELVALKAKIASDSRYQTDRERRVAMTNVFTGALTRHRVLYPPVIPIDPPQARPAWQESLEDAMNLGVAI